MNNNNNSLAVGQIPLMFVFMGSTALPHCLGPLHYCTAVVFKLGANWSRLLEGIQTRATRQMRLPIGSRSVTSPALQTALRNSTDAN
ncbi:hypothetical protein EYF80_043893 [Liparis tanakae]|uniref:Secreted protein n=1 Tax=Liparis tanakae TaxID=230148 RepID=A0A4Z2FYV8_9TELE|nr:hypothetical protein EYF80_043893 [Liparis tanakae]